MSAQCPSEGRSCVAVKSLISTFYLAKEMNLIHVQPLQGALHPGQHSHCVPVAWIQDVGEEVEECVYDEWAKVFPEEDRRVANLVPTIIVMQTV